MTVDLKVLGGLFQRLDEYLGVLRELAQTPRHELFADKARLGGARYYLQVAVECCINAANHIIARNEWGSPKSYGESFAVLAKHQVIPAEFVDTTQDGGDAQQAGASLLGGGRRDGLEHAAG